MVNKPIPMTQNGNSFPMHLDHESNTFEASDVLLYPHQNNGNRIFSNSIFDNKLIISSAETAVESPGYMDCAVYAGNVAAQKIIITR